MADASPAPAMTPAPQRELGIGNTGASAGDWWDSLTTEKVPELRWPNAYYVYDDMLTSPQVAGVFSAVVQTILGTGWRLDGTGCRPDITEHCARDLAVPIVGVSDQDDEDPFPFEDKFSWDEHVEIACDEYLRYGHSIFEQKAIGGPAGPDGLWHLGKLGWRSGRTLSFPAGNVARDGGLVFLEQSATTGTLTASTKTRPIRLPVGRVVVYVRDRRGGNWRGESLLRPAYGPWMMSSRAQRIELIIGERVGGPVVVYEAAEGETDLDRGQEDRHRGPRRP